MPAARETTAKKPTNLTLSEALVAEARGLGVNLSRAAERGLSEEIARIKAAQWQKDNAQSISDWNEYVETNGVPLARFRQF